MSGWIFHLVILFSIYSFIGWLLESVYRSITQRRPINAGFLYGPFVPIYGFGAGFIVILEYAFRSWHIVPQLFMYGIVLTLVEYVVALLFETVFKLKLWDYSRNRFNIQGRVCLLFSGFWAALALVFVLVIHPWISGHGPFIRGGICPSGRRDAPCLSDNGFFLLGRLHVPRSARRSRTSIPST